METLHKVSPYAFHPASPKPLNYIIIVHPIYSYRNNELNIDTVLLADH